MYKCHCLIRHAVTEEEQNIAKNNVEECLKNNDAHGVFITMNKLVPCPHVFEVVKKEASDGTKTSV